MTQKLRSLMPDNTRPIANEDQRDNRNGRADEGSRLYDRLAQVAPET
jgi:hypothetical protein